jgi:thioredoxin-like negative regulator of GroEL
MCKKCRVREVDNLVPMEARFSTRNAPALESVMKLPDGKMQYIFVHWDEETRAQRFQIIAGHDAIHSVGLVEGAISANELRRAIQTVERNERGRSMFTGEEEDGGPESVLDALRTSLDQAVSQFGFSDMHLDELIEIGFAISKGDVNKAARILHTLPREEQDGLLEAIGAQVELFSELVKLGAQSPDERPEPAVATAAPEPAVATAAPEPAVAAAAPEPEPTSAQFPID